MVDEAKAFCPACGNAFVTEEKRETKSNYESLDSTVQFGQTMYNQMLSDMGLNISKGAPAPQQKRVETIMPIAAAPKPPEQIAKASSSAAAEVPQTKSYLVWIIAGVVLLLAGFVVLIALALIFYFYYLQRG